MLVGIFKQRYHFSSLKSKAPPKVLYKVLEIQARQQKRLAWQVFSKHTHAGVVECLRTNFEQQLSQAQSLNNSTQAEFMQQHLSQLAKQESQHKQALKQLEARHEKALAQLAQSHALETEQLDRERQIYKLKLEQLKNENCQLVQETQLKSEQSTQIEDALKDENLNLINQLEHATQQLINFDAQNQHLRQEKQHCEGQAAQAKVQCEAQLAAQRQEHQQRLS